MKQRPRVVALISGRGSNLKALLDAELRGELGGHCVAVISNRADAAGLQHAAQVEADTMVVDHKPYAGDREAYDRELRTRIDAYQPDLVVLAGFMRILGEPLVNHYAGRMLNVHPSLLPAFPGLHTHERALEARVSRHGASVHFVTAGVDQGPVVLQGSVAVEADDTADALAGRVLHQIEHRIYPLAARWFCTGRLKLEQDQVWLDGQRLVQPLQLEAVQAREFAA